jgi:hypothetical protein
MNIKQNSKPPGVLPDPKRDEYFSNARGILKLISQGETDIRNEKVKSQKDVFKEIENMLKEKMR